MKIYIYYPDMSFLEFEVLDFSTTIISLKSRDDSIISFIHLNHLSLCDEPLSFPIFLKKLTKNQIIKLRNKARRHL